MHLRLFPGSPLRSRRPGRVLLQTLWKARAGPALRNPLQSSKVKVVCLFSLSPTRTQTHTHVPLRAPSSTGDFAGAARRAQRRAPLHHRPHRHRPRRRQPPAPPGHPPSGSGFHADIPQYRTMLQTLGKEGVEIYFMMANCCRGHAGIPTRATGGSQHVRAHGGSDG